MTLLTDMRGRCHAWLQICLQCHMVDSVDIVTGIACGAGNALATMASPSPYPFKALHLSCTVLYPWDSFRPCIQEMIWTS